MKPETRAIIISTLIVFSIIGALFGLLVYSFLYPEETTAFLNQYGWIIFTLIISAIVGLSAYFQGWIKAVRIIFIDHIHGGGGFAGITTEEPYEVNIKQLLFKDPLDKTVPDATVTVIPTGKILSRGTILVPLSKARGGDINQYMNRMRPLMKIYGARIHVEEFLASVYGLHIDREHPENSNPNDMALLRTLISKLDMNKVRRFIFIEPYEKPELIIEGLREATPSSSTVVLNALRKQRRHYTKIIEELQTGFEALAREYRQTIEAFHYFLSQVGKVSMRNVAIPLKLQSEAMGIPVHKVWESTAPQLMESPSSTVEIAKETRQYAEAMAQAHGLALAPPEILSEYEHYRKLFGEILGKTKVETPKEKEIKVKETVKKIEGK